MSTGIMITGPSGSGKTSLGKIVAEKLGFPYFDVDDYIWKKDTSAPYTQMYSKAEKISRLKSDIEPYKHFVMAGSMSSFHQAFDDKFAMMVFLYAEPEIRLQRTHKRAMERFGKRILEGGDLYESHRSFLESNRRYETDGSPNLGEQKEWMKSLPCEKIELDGTNSLESNAQIIVEKWNKMKREVIINKERKMCEECYSDKNRITPLLNPLECLKNHTQYICGTCGRCICIEHDQKRGLQRWNFPFKSLEVAKLYLRTADFTTKSSCGIYEIENSKGRLSYKIFATNEDLELFLKKNKDKKCSQMSPVFSVEKYKEYPHTQVRKLTPAEIKKYMSER